MDAFCTPATGPPNSSGVIQALRLRFHGLSEENLTLIAGLCCLSLPSSQTIPALRTLTELHSELIREIAHEVEQLQSNADETPALLNQAVTVFGGFIPELLQQSEITQAALMRSIATFSVPGDHAWTQLGDMILDDFDDFQKTIVTIFDEGISDMSGLLADAFQRCPANERTIDIAETFYYDALDHPELLKPVLLLTDKALLYLQENDNADDLALVLHIRATMLGELGRNREAVDAAEQSLAAQRNGSGGLQLALSIRNLLGHLAVVRQSMNLEELQLAEEAVELFH